MCGIAGILTFDGSKELESLAAVRTMTGLMRRRGPDAEGIWSDQKNCVLGFRRLAILDLTEAGHQPMVTENGQYALVYNGEIYNFKEIREELKAKGIRFRSTGDTEVVLNALALWKEKALEQFNGMFALAFYDKKEKKLLLARDHAGIKPLYYLLSPHGLVFGSQYDQITTHSWTQTGDVSSDGLALYLRFGYIPAPYALLRSTYMLEPGAWFEINAEEKKRAGKFFDFPLFQEASLRGEEAYEAIGQTVKDAVRRQLVSDVPIGGFLSGGIDSPLIVAEMQKTSRTPISAFTIGVKNYEPDESADAARYAKAFGVKHYSKNFETRQVLKVLEETTQACSEPLADYSIFPTLMVSELAGQHVKVMLSGDGGDELFWGYTGRFSKVLIKPSDFRFNQKIRALMWGMKKYFNYGEGHSNLCFRSIGDWYREKHTRLPGHFLKNIFPECPEWPSDYKAFEYTGSDVDQTAQWLRFNEFKFHLPMVLLKVDRASMFHSLEARVPLLDKEVIKMALKVDWTSCLDLKNEVGKQPLRYALSKHTKFQTKEKRGFSVPMDEWLRGPLREIFEEQVLNRKEILGVEVNRTELRKIFEEHLKGKNNLAGGLWTLLHLVLWKNRYNS